MKFIDHSCFVLYFFYIIFVKVKKQNLMGMIAYTVLSILEIL